LAHVTVRSCYTGIRSCRRKDRRRTRDRALGRLERERRKGEGVTRGPTGLRTFALASLAGAISFIVGGTGLLALVTAGMIALTAIAYFRFRSDDPGAYIRSRARADGSPRRPRHAASGAWLPVSAVHSLCFSRLAPNCLPLCAPYC